MTPAPVATPEAIEGSPRVQKGIKSGEGGSLPAGACLGGGLALQVLEDTCGAHPAADAHRDHPVA